MINNASTMNGCLGWMYKYWKHSTRRSLTSYSRTWPYFFPKSAISTIFSEVSWQKIVKAVKLNITKWQRLLMYPMCTEDCWPVLKYRGNAIVRILSNVRYSPFRTSTYLNAVQCTWTALMTTKNVGFLIKLEMYLYMDSICYIWNISNHMLYNAYRIHSCLGRI